MSVDVGKGEFKKQLDAALRVGMDDAVERLLARAFWTRPTNLHARNGRRASVGHAGLVIPLHAAHAVR